MVSNSARRVGRKILKKDGRHDSGITARRPGTVVAVDFATNLATLKISGDDEPIPGVVSDSNYVPLPGDRVWCDVTDGDVLITGRQGNSPAAFSGARWAEVATQEARGNTTAFGDCTSPTPGTPGPSVQVLIGERGWLELYITAEMVTSDSSDGGSVGVELSGANTVAATDNRALRWQPRVDSARACMSRLIVLTGLSPGLTTAKLVYKDLSGTDVTYAQREIAARPL